MFNPKAIKKGKKKLEEEIVERKSLKVGKEDSEHAMKSLGPKDSMVRLEARLAGAKKKKK